MKRVFSMKSLIKPDLSSGFKVDKTLTIKEYKNFDNFLIEINTFSRENVNLKIEPFLTNLKGLVYLRDELDKIIFSMKK